MYSAAPLSPQTDYIRNQMKIYTTTQFGRQKYRLEKHYDPRQKNIPHRRAAYTSKNTLKDF